MNEMIEKIISRHAIRKFQDRQIEEDVLEQILQAGLYAPSAGNNQMGTIVVCQDAEVNLQLGKINRSTDIVSKVDPKTVKAVSVEQPSIRDYYLSKALLFLLEQGAISQAEYEQVCRYNAEILHPDSEYIR